MFKRPAFHFDFSRKLSEFASSAMSTFHEETVSCVAVLPKGHARSGVYTCYSYVTGLYVKY
jgi:hypothetical protein